LVETLFGQSVKIVRSQQGVALPAVLHGQFLSPQPGQAEIDLVARDFRPVLWILQGEDVFRRETLAITTSALHSIDEGSQRSAWPLVFIRSFFALGPSYLDKCLPFTQELRVFSRSG